MQIAIVGAGLCGLAIAHYLIEKEPSLNITIIDENGIGHSTCSNIPCLTHLFSTGKSRLNWKGLESFNETCNLIDSIQKKSKKKIYSFSPIHRIAARKDQEEDFKKSAVLFPKELTFLSLSESKRTFDKLIDFPLLRIEKGLQVNTNEYLKGLSSDLFRKGVKLIVKRVLSINELKDYDHTVLTTGAKTLDLTPIDNLRFTKGQILKMSWPKDLPYPKTPIVSSVNLLLDQKKQHCYIGGTYEKKELTLEPNVDSAWDYLKPRLQILYPFLLDQEILDCRCGIRMSTPNRLPMVKKLDTKLWIFTAMGSKGLLYHAYLAKLLSRAILKNEPIQAQP